MLSRKDQDRSPTILPEYWHKNLEELLSSTYSLEEHDTKFEVYGATYPDELILAVSLVKSGLSSPITHIISAELSEGQYDKKLLDALVDFTGIFFDRVTVCVNWDEFHPYWTQIKQGDFSFYHKSSRENISLYLEAEKLLAHSSPSKDSP